MEQINGQTRGKMLRTSISSSLSLYWSEQKSVLIICGIAVIMRVALPYLGILMPRVVLDQIAAQVEPRQFFITVGSLAALLVVVNYIKSFTDSITNEAVGTVGVGTILVQKMKKMMNMDFELMEDPDFKTVDDKAMKAATSNHAPAMNIPRTLVELLSNSLGFLLYASVIAVVHPLILVILFITSTINWLMLRRARNYMEATRDERSKKFRKLNSLSETLRNPDAAKDIRLYGAFGWLKGIYGAEFASHRKAERKLLSKNMHAQLADALMILLRDGAAYAFLIWLILDGRMTLGEFVFIFAAIGALAGWISGILTAASDLNRACVEMRDIAAALEYPDRMNTGTGAPLPQGDNLPPSIEFRNVSYTYPKAEKAALSGIDLTIDAGERIAIVGANGAGKTTFVKLLCGLYSPSEGEVLLNGSPVGAYNRDEYYTLFSTVFQDIHMLSASVAENISQQPPELTDRENVRRCLELTGLSEKTDSLPDKEDTLLVRAVHQDAAELSGGEKQKLAMSRALYKNAPVIVLDEPTAALDPIAENEVYQRYAELTEGKTSVYISHRLASTRFCDRILLIDGNAIAEQGSHEQLMALGGLYANMFEVQASYYQDSNGEGAE
ncbi:MAG: ABC transporter ATP-binding protein/permease [Oscillospiraceae bacterium]|nr:ABC transporter ATP-binding protein/permease [Oscillospiraceae bacterium]